MASDRQLQWMARNRSYRDRSEPVGAIVERIAKKMERENDPKLAAAQAIWTGMLGAEFVGLAFPSALRRGILEVSVSSPAAKFTIEQIHRPALLEELRSELGLRIRDIKCVLQPLPAG